MSSLSQVGTNFRPNLRPAIVSGAEKRKEFCLHVRVFKAEVFLVEVRALGEPVLELAGSFDDVHAGNDNGEENGKSNGEGLFTTEAQRHGERMRLSLVFFLFFLYVNLP